MTDDQATTPRVLCDVVAELLRQENIWGEQNHPDGTTAKYRTIADYARETCQDHAAEGTVTWHLILREEMYEAFAEEDPARLRTELIQVAAVAITWAEAIDRRTAGESTS